MRPSEILAMRRVTQGLIQWDGATIVIHRKTRVRNSAGGYDTTPLTLDPQRVKLAKSPLKRRRQAETGTPLGLLSSAYDRMIGDTDLDAAEQDEFVMGTDEYKITQVLRLEYETVCSIELR